jgi:hypothetical protein
MDEDSQERRGFRVTDRRRFSESGEARGEGPEESTPTSPPAAAASAPAPEPPLHEETVNFSTFVLGLSTQALLHLGEIPDPVSGAEQRDLTAAKQVIDILGVLRDKTRNNLEPGEQSLLDSVLYDLRMRYVELVRPGPKEGA